MSSVCYVKGLLCLGFVCLGFVMSRFCLSRFGYGTDSKMIRNSILHPSTPTLITINIIVMRETIFQLYG